MGWNNSWTNLFNYFYLLMHLLFQYYVDFIKQVWNIKLLKIIFEKTQGPQEHKNKNALETISINPLLFIFQKDIKEETDG